jgi:hypothetical protein
VLTDLSAAIAGKADIRTLDQVRTDLTASISSKADSVAVEKMRIDLTKAIDRRVVIGALDGKADVTVVDRVRTELTTSLAAKADAAAMEKLRGDIDVSVTGLRNQVKSIAERTSAPRLQKRATKTFATKTGVASGDTADSKPRKTSLKKRVKPPRKSR